ncbi:MAG: hypothetical protein M3P18_02180, partial [Actinomycetota bacterium]|nr:hypothetical protein [Actinomycetota bacterium]
MTRHLDHHACSELLRAYVAGDSGEDAAAVSEHLEECPDCRSEQATLEMLLSPVEPLTPRERSHLRATVAAAMEQEAPVKARRSLTAVAAGDGSHRQPWRWVTPALSAAAAVLLIAGGLFFLGRGGTNSSFNTAAPAARAPDKNAELARPATPGAGGAGPEPTFATSTTAFAGEKSSPASTQPAVIASFAASYSGSQARSLSTTFLDRLAQDAPSGAARQVRICGRRVLAARKLPVLPAYGTYATVRGEPALVLEFASSDTVDGPLTRFMLFAWPR